MTVSRSRDRHPALLYLIETLLALAVLIPVVTYAQSSPPGATTSDVRSAPEPPLPKPTGGYAVGSVVFHWTDWTRVGVRDTAGPRELVGQLWYPAIASVGPPAYGRYAPLVPELTRTLTHAVTRARPASTGPFPMVVLCPGRGVPRFAYTALAEDLASHGIAVFGVDLPMIGRVFMPDGRIVPASPVYRMPPGLISGPYEQVDRFFEEATARGRSDIAFALTALRSALRSSAWFATLIDWRRLGAFGHSLGGRICGAAVADDSRFRAFASMEGIPPRVERRAGFRVPVLLAVGSSFPESALENLREMVPKRRARVDIVRLTGFTHNAMTDDVVMDSASVGASVASLVAITRTRGLLRGFFVEAFSGRSGTPEPGGDGGWRPPDDWGIIDRHPDPRPVKPRRQ
jgi:dienelactone hydrolase